MSQNKTLPDTFGTRIVNGFLQAMGWMPSVLDDREKRSMQTGEMHGKKFVSRLVSRMEFKQSPRRTASKRRQYGRRMLATEGLESRALLSAVIAMDGDDLTVIGSSAADTLTFTSDGTNLTILDSSAGSKTLNLPSPIPGSAGNGTSVVTIPLTAFVNGNLVINGGDGDDSITIGSLRLGTGQGLNVAGGTGSGDYVTISGAVSIINAPISITANDRVSISASINTGGGEFTVVTGSGTDLDSSIAVAGPIHTGGGNLSMSATKDIAITKPVITSEALTSPGARWGCCGGLR